MSEMKMRMQTELWLNRLAGLVGKMEITGEHSGVHHEMEKNRTLFVTGQAGGSAQGGTSGHRGLGWLVGPQELHRVLLKPTDPPSSPAPCKHSVMP